VLFDDVVSHSVLPSSPLCLPPAFPAPSHPTSRAMPGTGRCRQVFSLLGVKRALAFDLAVVERGELHLIIVLGLVMLGVSGPRAFSAFEHEMAFGSAPQVYTGFSTSAARPKSSQRESNFPLTLVKGPNFSHK